MTHPHNETILSMIDDAITIAINHSREGEKQKAINILKNMKVAATKAIKREPLRTKVLSKIASASFDMNK
jgi:hypothetical protein